MQAVVPRGKQLLRINLVETSVAYIPDTLRGLVVSRRHWGARGGRRPVIKGKEARGACTYVAMICDDQEVQKVLPQIIIGNRRRFTSRLLRTVAPHKPKNVRVWCGNSAWNNHRLMCKVLCEVAAAVRDVRHKFQITLVLDMAPCHLHATVLQTASQLNIWLLYVPARTTFLLQPLDTHCFASFKMWLRRRFQDARKHGQDGQVSPAAWLRILYDLPLQFLAGRTWREAFMQNGLGGSSSSVRPDVSQLLQSLRPLPLEPLFPSLRELRRSCQGTGRI